MKINITRIDDTLIAPKQVLWRINANEPFDSHHEATFSLVCCTDLLCGQIVALGNLLVQLADVAEVRYQSCGTAVSQLAVEDQRGRLGFPVGWSRHLLLQRSTRSNPGTVTPRDIIVVVTVGLMMVAILHAVCGFLRCRRSWRSPRLE